jgi:apolipoprotein D and lipocalin family protein
MANAAFRSALLSVVLLLTAPHGVVLAQTCVAAPPQAGFAPSDYTGVWYEIGKIQTAGGAIFESSCVCTQLIVAAAADPVAPGDATVLNSCRDKTPQGAFINASAQLVNMAPPGHWDETFVPPAWKCVRRQRSGSVTRG